MNVSTGLNCRLPHFSAVRAFEPFVALTSIGNHLFIRSFEFQFEEREACTYACRSSGSLSFILSHAWSLFSQWRFLTSFWYLSLVQYSSNEIIRDGELSSLFTFFIYFLLLFYVLYFITILQNAVVPHISKLWTTPTAQLLVSYCFYSTVKLEVNTVLSNLHFKHNIAIYFVCFYFAKINK